MQSPKPSAEPFATFLPHTRDENLDRLETREFDVCVIGGGITGAGVALDCASRGLSVALLEKGDFASGSSSRSSRLVHGGLRYLGTGDVSLCRECIRERDLLHRLAPHLVRPQRFLYLLMGQRSRSTVQLGLTLHDLLAGPRGFGLHRRVRNGHPRELAPLVREDRLQGVWSYVDATTDDARLVMCVLGAAHAFGATVANYVRVESFERTNGHLDSVAATDVVRGRSFSVRAKAIVNATGVWSNDLTKRGGSTPVDLWPSKGIHLVVPSDRLPIAAACVFPAEDGREVFLVPDRSVVFVGTTDTEYSGSLDAPAVEPGDVGYLLASVNAAFEVELQARDVVAGWAGLRPLIDNEDEHVSDRSRSFRVSVAATGLVTVAGGKLTVYRAMAEKATDAVCELMGERRHSRTKRIQLGFPHPHTESARAAAYAAELGIPDATAERMIGTYGARVGMVLDLVAGDLDLSEQLVPGHEPLAAEAIWAIRHEMAMTLDDVLTRRLRLASRDREAGLDSRALELIASERGWSSDEELAHLRAYRRTVAHERGPLIPPRFSQAVSLVP